jgi:AcrR family transcriptional regulator
VTVEPVVDRPRRRTQAERRASTRGALLDATIEVLVEVGYASLTTSQVVARAGVTRGAQAHYFATKADLVVQALNHLTDRLVAEMVAQPLRSVDGIKQQYEALLNRLWEIYAGPASTALLELFVAARTDAELREQLVRFDHAIAQTLTVTARTVAPSLAESPGFREVMVTSIATIRGLWLLRAVASERQVRRLWPAARAQLMAGHPLG